MNFEFGNTYNFRTISNTVLAPEYRNMTVQGIMGFKQAVKYSGAFTDVVTIREKLVTETQLPLVPADKAKYILFENEYGENIILAEDWIKLDTVILVTSIELNLTIKNITTDDVNIIVDTLRAMGYDKIDVNITSDNISAEDVR